MALLELTLKDAVDAIVKVATADGKYTREQIEHARVDYIDWSNHDDLVVHVDEWGGLIHLRVEGL